MLLKSNPEPPRPDRLGSTTIDYYDVKSILNKASGFIDSYDFTLNPYKGCSFSCSYCYSPNMLGVDPDEWGTWVEVKQNAITLLKKSKNLRGKKIYLGSVTDGYQPIENKLELTRGILKILIRHQPKLVIQTRGPLITRDIDLLQQFETLKVQFTITTDDDSIRKKYEPKCASIPARFKAVEKLVSNQIPTTLTLSPLLPVTDPEAFAHRIGTTLPNGTTVIAQPLHPPASHKRRYSAGTRAGVEVNKGYQNIIDTIRPILKEYEMELVLGREGFRCPL